MPAGSNLRVTQEETPENLFAVVGVNVKFPPRPEKDVYVEAIVRLMPDELWIRGEIWKAWPPRPDPVIEKWRTVLLVHLEIKIHLLRTLQLQQVLFPIY